MSIARRSWLKTTTGLLAFDPFAHPAATPTGDPLIASKAVAVTETGLG